MNLENVNYSIDLLKSQRKNGIPLGMIKGQYINIEITNKNLVLFDSISELNESKEPECLSVILSLSSKWQSDGHSINNYGVPIFYNNGMPSLDGTDAIAEWLGITFNDGFCLCYADVEDFDLYGMAPSEVGYDEVIGVLETLRDTGSVWGGE